MMKFMFKCKLCGTELPKPSSQHIKEDMQKAMDTIKEKPTGEFFDLVFTEEWGD